MKSLNNINQTLNVKYHQSLDPTTLNKIFYQLFSAGVIEGIFDFDINSVTISAVSFLIHPQNQSDILVRIDTTIPIIISNTSPTNIYLIARYRWENENIGAEFLFADDNTIVETDVILIGLTLDANGKILALNYDTQERARLKVIRKDTPYPVISKLDGYTIGNNSGEIPISNGTLNTNLNAQYLDGKEITDLVVSKDLPIILSEGDSTTVMLPILPDWMDGDAVDKGDGVTAEFVMNKKIQPQDGTTIPTLQNQIAVANTILQKNLNTEFLGGYTHDKFSKITHRHTLDEIYDDGNISIPHYYKVSALKTNENLATADSIADDDIDYTNIDMLAYDATLENWYRPIYETGSFNLTGYTEVTITFSRNIKNARVILQRSPASTETLVAGTEKRTARITEISNTYFKVKQMGSIIDVTGDYKRIDANDAAATKYSYFIIGEIG